MQDIFEITEAMFERVRLQINGAKTKVMDYMPVFLQANNKETAYHLRIIGYDPSFWEWKIVNMECSLCGAGLARG